MTSRITTAVLAVTLLFVVGCSDDTNTGPKDIPAQIRLLHNVYDGAGLDLRVNNVVVASGVTYNTSSGYKQVAAATSPQADVSVHYAGDPNPRNSSKQTLGEGLAYTVYAFPPAAAFSAGFQNDPRETTPDKSRIKFVNATSDTFKYELYITGSKNRLMGPVNRTQVNQYIDVFAGSYAFSIKKQGDTTFSLEYNPVTLQPQGAYTIVMHGTQREDDAYPFAVRMYTDNGPGTEYLDWVKAAASGRLSYVHAVVGSSPVDIAVDGNVPQITGLAFGTATTYLTFAAGDHTYTVGAGSTALLSNSPVNIQARKSYSIFLSGTKEPLDVRPVTLENATTANMTQALVRFIHLSPDAPRLNVITPLGGNDYAIPGMQGLSFRQVSNSSTTGSDFLLLPPGTYSIKFVDADSKAVLLDQPNMVYNAGQIYTLWLGGSTAGKTLKAYNVLHN